MQGVFLGGEARDVNSMHNFSIPMEHLHSKDPC